MKESGSKERKAAKKMLSESKYYFSNEPWEYSNVFTERSTRHRTNTMKQIGNTKNTKIISRAVNL